MATRSKTSRTVEYDGEYTARRNLLHYKRPGRFMRSDSHEITQILQQLRSSGGDAQDRLAAIIYKQLRRLAAVQLRGERPNHTLQPTALAHEAFLRLVGADIEWQNRAHFFAITAQVMRRILVDHARCQRADKRGGALNRIQIDETVAITAGRPVELLALDEALGRLHHLDPRQASIVEMRFFGGMTESEIGEVLGVHARTVKRDWAVAKAWLHGELNR